MGDVSAYQNKRGQKQGRQQALVSIHDIMPETLDDTLEILKILRKMKVYPVTLLIVPGTGWGRKDMALLRSLQREGFDLAGHGLQHRIRRLKGPVHRLHSALISRNEAEHLSCTQTEAADIIKHCFYWFGHAGLDCPELYVPPAWALGPLSLNHLSRLPFRYVETQTGLLDTRENKFVPLPLTGYMADTGFRVKALRLFNRINRQWSSRPLRIGIHPKDKCLPLWPDLCRDLEGCEDFLRYPQVMAIRADT